MFTYYFLKRKISTLFPNKERNIIFNIYIILALLLLSIIIFAFDILTIPFKIICFIFLVIKEEV